MAELSPALLALAQAIGADRAADVAEMRAALETVPSDAELAAASADAAAALTLAGTASTQATDASALASAASIQAATVAGQVATLDTDVTGLTTGLAGVASDVAGLTDDVEPLPATVAGLVAAVTELQQTPSQQLARYATGDAGELVATLPIATIAPTKFSVYSLEIPDLAAGDVLLALADFQGTHEQSYNVLFSTQILACETADGTAGTEVSEGAGTNITPGNHHMQVSRSGSLVVTNPARRFINLVASAAASNALPGHELVVDQDYGRLTVLRIRTVAGVSGLVPTVNDDAPSLATTYSSAKVLQLLADLPEEVAGLLDLALLEAEVDTLRRQRSTAEVTASSPVATLVRQNVGTSVGTVGSGTGFAARARVTQSGLYGKVRFCTGTTAPAGITDLRVGVWSTVDGTPRASSANASATVNAASTLYEIALTAPIELAEGEEVYLGVAVVGTTPGTYRGNASFTAINNLEPAISKARTAWAGGTLPTLTSSYSGIIWAELVLA